MRLVRPVRLVALAVAAAGVGAVPAVAPVTAPSARAVSGDTHIVGVSEIHTIDCGGGTLFVNAVDTVVHALGTCWAVTMQGSRDTVIADTVVNDITVYGFDQTVYYKNGDPLLFDRGRELGMTNRLQRVPG